MTKLFIAAHPHTYRDLKGAIARANLTPKVEAHLEAARADWRANGRLSVDRVDMLMAMVQKCIPSEKLTRTEFQLGYQNRWGKADND